jgi:Cu-Zn family superoxide dismutase
LPSFPKNNHSKEDRTMKRLLIGLLAGIFLAGYAYGEELVISIHRVNAKGVGEQIGTVTLSDSPYGLILTPDLKGLPPGIHGFHVHQNPNCGPAQEGGKSVPALAAGGHYDPEGTGRHEGPYGKGHLGDLPALSVDKSGRATLPVLAPRLKANDVKGHSLIIHAGGDNYSDQPKKLGGGGSRIACGVAK